MRLRVLEGTAILAAGGLLAWFFLDALLQPFYCGFGLTSDQLSGLHLAQSFAFLHGFKYPSLTDGVFLTPIYGPVGFCFYWPAALFSLPSNAMLAAQGISLLCFFSPAFWILTRKDPQAPAAGGLLAFLVFGLLASTRPEFKYCAFGIHVDAPAIFLAAVAAALLLIRGQDSRKMMFSALCAVLSVWSKQTMLPVAVALTLYIWISQGKRPAMRYSGFLLLFGIAVTAFILCFFNARDLWLNMVTVPSRHPWAAPNTLRSISVSTERLSIPPDGAQWAMMVLRQLFQSIKIQSVLLLLALCVDLKTGSFKRGFSSWAVSNPWFVFALAGVFLLPSAFLGKVKIGGGTNNFGLALYFLSLAALLTLTRRRATGLLILCALMAWTVPHDPRGWPKDPLARNEKRFIADKAWRFALDHPGEAYFPGIPLANMMAEKKAYHSPVGVWERQASGLQLSGDQFKAGLPARMKWIVLGPSFGFMPILTPYMRRFPGWSTTTDLPELPDWVVFVQKNA